MPRKKILVVDDSVVVREQVALALKGAGYETLEAGDGVEARQLVRANRDLAMMVCDHNMPRMAGLDLVELLKTEGILSFPVAMLTSEARPELLARAKAVGARAWMIEPVVPSRLVSVVDKLTK